jgi:peptidoglycan/LPS O-acetylase OafA/YrhL
LRRAERSTELFRQEDSLRRGLRGLAVGITLLAVLGTVTAVWVNPLFVRMTPVGPWEFGATVLTALLAGMTSAFWVPACRLRGSGAGGLASFLGIACPTCNKVLMFLFGGPALLGWFDPLRPWLAAAGVVMMGVATLLTWRRFRDARTRDAAGEGRLHPVQGDAT